MIKLYLKNLATVVLLFVLTLSLFSFFIYAVVKSGATNESFYVNIMEKAEEEGYYDILTASAQKDIIFKGTLSGMDKSVFEDLLNKETVRKLAKESISQILSQKPSPTLDGIITQIEERALAQLDEKDVSELPEFLDYMRDEISLQIRIPFMTAVYPSLKMIFDDYSPLIIISFLVVILICSIGLFFFNNRSIKSLLTNLSFSLVGSGLMVLAFAIFFLCINDGDIFNFSTQALRMILSSIKSTLVCALSVVGGTSVILGTGIIIYRERVLK